MKNTYKNCQSCGMPLNKDPQHGGTNSDGSKSAMYCSLCYENGQFKQSEWTVDQMTEFVKNKMKEMGFPGFLAGLFSRGVKKLERWKKK